MDSSDAVTPTAF